jgi:hypothetical protein
MKFAAIHRYKSIHDASDTLTRSFSQWIRRNTICLFSVYYQNPLLNLLKTWSSVAIK